MAYATVSDVQKYTGMATSQSVIDRAQAIIELYTNRTEEGSKGVTDRDLHWLKLATCYQTAYMITHPEVYSLMDAESFSQGDLSVRFRGHADGAVIAPLAKKALGQVRWNRSRSILVKSDFITNSDIHDGLEGDWEDF